MKILDAMDIKGRLTIQKRNTKNQIIEEVRANNSIVLSGRELVANLFVNDKIKPISEVAVGTGTNEVTINDTKLGNEIFKKNINPIDQQRGDLKFVADTQDAKNTRMQVRITADLQADEALGTLTEAALFTADGVMYNRVVFPAINKTKDFQLTLIWEILF